MDNRINTKLLASILADNPDKLEIIERELGQLPPAKAAEVRKEIFSIDPLEEVSTQMSYPLTDLGNAERLAAHASDKLKYVSVLGWLGWNGQCWEQSKNIAWRLAQQVVRSIPLEVGFAEDDEKAAIKITRWAIQSESEAYLRAMLELAQKNTALEAHVAEFDVQPYLFNCANGTLDLNTGELHPHDPADRLTHLSPVAYDPKATCPTWLAFLSRIFDQNESMLAFIQRAVGYSLTSTTTEHALFMLHGRGANGKSTFLETLRFVFGHYGQQAEFSTFLAKQNDSIRNDLARMVGKRLVTASEATNGRRLDEALVKSLTGGDKVTARFLFKEHFEYLPVYKIWLATNYKPSISGTDDGIWRRVCLIPFAVTIPEAERDQKLLGKLKDEAPGILAWAVQGCLEWQANGLGKPTEVIAAINSYRAEEDLFGGFLAECCITNERAQTKASHLYAGYTHWAVQNGEQTETQRRFGTRLGERGFTRKHTNQGDYWQGIGLRAQDGIEE